MTTRVKTSADAIIPEGIGADEDHALGHLRVGGVFDTPGRLPIGDAASTAHKPVRPRPFTAVRILAHILSGEGTTCHPQTDGVPAPSA